MGVLAKAAASAYEHNKEIEAHNMFAMHHGATTNGRTISVLRCVTRLFGS